MTLLVEVIASHSCTGCIGPLLENDRLSGLPSLLRALQSELGFDIDYRQYEAWSHETGDPVLPPHVREKLARIRGGTDSPWGLFLDGEWVSLSRHNAADAIALRRRIAAKLGRAPDAARVHHVALPLESAQLDHCESGRIRVNDCRVESLEVSGSEVGRVAFHDGSVREMTIDGRVDSLLYDGYDLVKLLEIARADPDRFDGARVDEVLPPGRKARADEVSVHLLEGRDLDERNFPCHLSGNLIEPDSRLHRETARRYGGWGYVARHGSRVCGWMGIGLKPIVRRDAGGYNGFNPPGDDDLDRTLLLLCLFAGGRYGPEYERIGIASKMVARAVADARAKGMARIEANPHDAGAAEVFRRNGFQRIPWTAGGQSPRREQAFYRLEL